MKEQETRNREQGAEKRALAIFAGALLLSDQVAKYIFSGSVLAYCNPDGPLGIPVDNGMLIAVLIAALTVAGYLLFAKTGFSRDSAASLGMTIQGFAFIFILAGGISNLVDRILFGCVRDFALVSWLPALNLADIFLTIGAVLFLFSVLRKK